MELMTCCLVFTRYNSARRETSAPRRLQSGKGNRKHFALINLIKISRDMWERLHETNKRLQLLVEAMRPSENHTFVSTKDIPIFSLCFYTRETKGCCCI